MQDCLERGLELQEKDGGKRTKAREEVFWEILRSESLVCASSVKNAVLGSVFIDLVLLAWIF